ncbi:site-2 protease family protein [Microlunatus panaciterrae]|nr:site-2 protease family protein [Microlunatus panaciterrae]
MRGTFGIGRIAGVAIRIHWSVAVIFALIAWSLATVTFPGYYPKEPRWMHIVAGLTAAVVFLLGLLAHELSHAVVARRNGVEVDNITLWLLGGVAQLRGKAGDPGSELRIAGVGPLVSVLIGLAFGLGTLLLSVAGVSGLLVGAFAWLAGINLLLAVFNAIPAAPLDGGRLLHAALWKWRGDYVWAAVAAARAGRVLGFILVLLGLGLFLQTGILSSLWSVLLGWFLARAASAEEQQVLLDDALQTVRVRDVMSPEPETVPADITVAALIDEYLFQRRHSSFPLVDQDGRLVGLITLRRIKEVPVALRSTTRARDIACPATEVVTTAPDEPLPELIPRLGLSADGRALVLQAGELVGIVSPSDVSQAAQRAMARSHPASLLRRF